MLTSNKIDFKVRSTTGQKRTFHYDEGSISQGNGRILKLYASNNIVSLYV